MILPPLLADTAPSEYTAVRFARAGFSVLAVLPPSEGLAYAVDPDDAVAVLRERLWIARAALRFAARELEASCRVLVGVSLGALTAVPAAALEGEVEAVVLMLAGGGLSWVGQNSRHPAIQQLLPEPSPAGRRRLQALDPLTWAPELDGERVLLLSARWDRVIPPPSTATLRSLLPGSAERVYPVGHETFSLVAPLAAGAAVEHAARFCPEPTDD